MKPQVFFPLLIAAAGLTALMLLFANIAQPVASLPSSADPGGSTAADVITVPITLPWQAVAPGIDYVQLTLTSPANNVYITRMHRDNYSVTLDTSIASGFLADGLKETVSQMAARYDQAINYWGQAPFTPTWGNRNDVVVAINGYYYDKPTGYPWSGMVQSGWYAKRFDDYGGGSGFAWKLDRSAFIGECVQHLPEKQFVKYADGSTQRFQGINVARGDNDLIVYTPQYYADTGTDNSGAEVLVELSRPLLIIPKPRVVTGTVSAIYTDTGSTPIPFDSVVLSAVGPAKNQMLAHVQVGDVVGISQEVSSYYTVPDCTVPMSLDWSKTYASLGGDFYFLKGGIIQHFPNNGGATSRDPRTAIVFDKSFIYFIVVDGRSWLSRGMTIDELAAFVSDTIATTETLTATYGIAQDGGGSSTMVVNGQVMNNTLCNNIFCEHFNFLPLVGRPSGTAAPSEPRKTPTQAQPAKPEAVDAVPEERYVANGVMMIAVQPMQTSTTFTSTQMVSAPSGTRVRLGPGTNYAAIKDIDANTSGVIVNHEMNGVLAKGYFWWKVDFGGGTVGWVPESDLISAIDNSR